MPGMMTLCERCRVATPELKLNETHDEYWCDSCFDNEAEAAWERHNESLMENGPGPTLQEQQVEARKLK